MEKIKINKDTTINLNFETQTSKLGRPFRLSGTRYNLQLPTKWIDGMERRHVIHQFIYLDEQGGYFDVEVDYYSKFVSLVKVIQNQYKL